ncbi:MAG TPA: MHYT domain-containing protein [Magnetospirillaceae bacterium]
MIDVALTTAGHPIYMEHSHGWMLVTLSFALAFFAAYTALDMAERLENAQGRARVLWLAGASVVLGGGIWAMHFIGMLAMRIDMPVTYDAGLTILSKLIAILFTAVGFMIIGRKGTTPRRLIAAGTVVGLGVAAMHYTGMAALVIPARLHFDPLLVTASVVIAVVAAIAAFWLAFNWKTIWQKIFAAAIMATAICGMHYTGMAALSFEPDRSIVVEPGSVSPSLLAIAVTAATFILLCIALVSVFIDRRFESRAADDARKLRVANAELQAEIAERKVAEARLHNAHNALELRVQERTKELAQANQRLMDAAVELDSARAHAESEKERAEAANRAKSDFLASVSHELRTPLNAVLGFAQLLELNAKEPLTERQSRQVSQISKSGNHLLALIDEILDLSKIEAGTLRISLERVPLSSIFDQVRNTLQPMAEAMEVTLQVDDLAFDIPPVRADRIRLTQILINLGTNAIKYNRSGGVATLRAELAVPGMVRISMTDTGIGIASHRQAELFQPFNRLGAEHGTIEGSGIGLTIAQRLVQLMGGTLTVQSVPGEGSTFSVDMPIAPAEDRAALRAAVDDGSAEKPAWQHQDGRYTLLYVEDNPSNIALMQELVDTLPNLRMLIASDGNTGIALAKAHKPDIIVLDINLPGMSGFDVLRELKRQPTTVQIPVIALSAAAAPRDIQRGKAEGFLHYLTKPINIPEFVAAVGGLLGERRENV